MNIFECVKCVETLQVLSIISVQIGLNYLYLTNKLSLTIDVPSILVYIRSSKCYSYVFKTY